MGTKSGAGRRNQDILGTGVDPRTLCVEEKQIRPMQIAATHIRMPHRNGTGRRKGGHIHGIQRQRAAQNTERRIQLHSDNGNTGAPVLRILRLPREQFLRTVEPFRNTRRTKVAHRHGTRDGNCCDNGHRAQPRREKRDRRAGKPGRRPLPILLRRRQKGTPCMGQSVLRLRKRRRGAFSAQQLQILDAGIPIRRIPVRRSDLDAVLQPRTGRGVLQLRRLLQWS